MIGRKHQQHALVVLLQHVQCGQRDGRRRVARRGLQQNAAARHADGLKLLAHHEPMVLGADRDHWRHIMHRLDPQCSRLEQGFITHQRQELLGRIAARARPQARSAATTQNDGMKHPASSTLESCLGYFKPWQQGRPGHHRARFASPATSIPSHAPANRYPIPTTLDA